MPFLTRRTFALGALAACGGPVFAQDAPPDFSYAERGDAMRWAAEAAARLGLDAQWAQQSVGRARFSADAQRLMRPAAYSQASSAARNWRAYRKRFLTAVHLEAGRRFWQAQRATLARVEQVYGVSAAAIAGILGVETIYGRNVGKHRVLDVLATLAFDFPQDHPRAAQRQTFFARELGHFLALCRESGMEPDEPRGSYAGAMGLPQFMPSSWRQWAVDFDGDGRIDLWGSAADVCASVANYFRAFGWRPGLPTHYGVSLRPQADMAALLEHDILPTLTAQRMQELGALLPEEALAHEGPLALIELQKGEREAPTYVAGTENFYVITRYNWSAYYAMAVIELGRLVAAQAG